MFSGPIATVIAGPVDAYLKEQGGDIGRYFSPYAKNGAMCAPIIGVVPTQATVVGFRFMAHDAQSGWGGCETGVDCSIGWSKFQADPAVQQSAAMQTVTAMFMNWSDSRSRTARMIVFYQMPAGQQPITQM